MSRRANGEGSVYRAADGRWHVELQWGADPRSGRPRRSHSTAPTQKAALAKLDEMRRKARVGVLDKEKLLVGDWLDLWLSAVAVSLKPSTRKTYETNVGYLRARWGSLRLHELRPEHLERLYGELRERGHASATVAGVHRTIRASLNEAVRREWIEKNPATHARPGRVVEQEVVPLTTEEAKAILDVAATKRNGARWAVALALGLRQGEALGLCWDDLDLDAGELRVRRAIQRVPWRHGCGATPCGGSASTCPRRYGGGLIEVEPKSAAGRRTMALPSSLTASLRAHGEAQRAEREFAGSMWRQGPHGGWVFANAVGRPIDSRKDWAAWKELLREAGVRDVRLHDARHSAATYLLIQGVDARTVMGIPGVVEPQPDGQVPARRAGPPTGRGCRRRRPPVELGPAQVTGHGGVGRNLLGRTPNLEPAHPPSRRSPNSRGSHGTRAVHPCAL